MAASPHVEMIRTAIEALNRRDFEAALASMAEDATWVPFLAAAETPLLRGRDAVREAWRSQFEVMDIRVEITEVVAETDDVVVLELEMHGRGSGSDVALSQRFAQIYTFDGSLVTSIESFATAAEALAAASLPE